MKNVVLTGGGTGGHLFAAIEFARFLKDRGYNPVIIGSVYGIENRILKKYPFDYVLLKSKGIMGKGLKDRFVNGFANLDALIHSIGVIKKLKPEFCVGFGGYVSLPVVLSCVILRRKSAILEQNSIPGKANRLLSRLVDLVFVNFDYTAQFLRGSIVVGNPTRIKTKGKHRLFDGRLKLGVVGGSRGARSINNSMIELSEFDLDIDVIHQTGVEDYSRVKDAYKRNGKNWQVVDFIEDMESFYKGIDFIICRSGASTLSEIACAGLGSILIPYPYAIYNHQYYNAKYFLDNEASIIIEDKDLSGKTLHTFISSLTADRLRVMSENAFDLCRRDACEKMLSYLEMVKR
ncbi:undecaprenyldiphospho-muramoylpentapeptide beta-N-acetylglucosaminyltransferase [Hippea maritima]|uniref:UDP-N-acetylglucosamine--N-acetylmuramyl-(pentapeptide) pyrophosphoryl-undecaprenol N-acetylglucosamine transferase n=1 Tax=Hippea maritima (strain ATCC 700847 / DSM 10411 / MH2) TaxID=760142 RepID=F2LW36_HIPMA|nr:undecaprenyldiphospho-muramoylpentapeptide beta-N-acetylglucosaminyltransferase [Hippea maritima]AEA33970.1 UDP-N-acetylglucosamine--N-acetylmuramyl- (pentapeptide) pyrophosphoryl-undecaprenol N-acetylglucosamine transferase [Hippea maritima DSM 10411]